MDKIISTIPGFTGEIEFKEFITLDLIETYLDIRDSKYISPADRREQLFDAVCAWTSIWRIEGQPEHPTHKTFVPIPSPGIEAPYVKAMALFKMVENAVKNAITGIQTIPNA